MQILIKALNGRQFKMDLEPEKTVLDLKQEIQKNEGPDYNVDSQKLIYEGKILANTNKLSEYNIDPKKFLVLLITRPPPPPKKVEEPKPTTATSLKKEDPKTDKQDKKDETARSSTRSIPPTNPNPNAPATAASPTRSSTSTTTTRVSVPVPSPNPNDPNAARNRNSAVRSSAQGGTQPQADYNLASRLSHLSSLPHFANLQATLHQNPHLLSSAIESLSTVDPEMYQFVSENPDIFLTALNGAPNPRAHRPTSGHPRGEAATGQALVSGAGGGGAEDLLGISHMLPSATENDKQAIERLKELGFSEFQAIQAYVACDKDEQLAANLLFSMDQ